MKIAFFEVEDWEEQIIRSELPGHDILVSKDKVTPLTLPPAGDADIVSVFIDSRIDKTVLASFPSVKLVATRSTGYDHIDQAACAERGVSVANVPGYGDNTVAEFALGMLFNLTRKMYQGIDQIKETGSFRTDGLRGMDIRGRTIGIVGTGRIGKEMVRLAKGVGMQVIAFDPFPDQAFAAGAGISYVSFDDLLARADFISIHCPYTPQTHHLVNRGNIGKVKRGAYLVNTARGGIVETQALVDGLEQGILAGAALDVLEEEGETKDEINLLRIGHPKEEELKTMLENHILMKMPNVLITPHIAFDSQEALQRILSVTIKNIRGFAEGKPENLVKM